ncbi:alpha/beta fold hydrolase [Saccharothrix yanglingensis]|uniref:Alpha/beta hydrolase n=1 Tax=Saccharothrix yanglingensis TaxID=659496 RepID=A0ABU0WX21_9PSEU|nr:alpha/beta hydrolase [Saccharothrix yanglingensis]MDQ2583619.1 alpha/beta hydrolase [Saccharothrix yanglingensis]
MSAGARPHPVARLAAAVRSAAPLAGALPEPPVVAAAPEDGSPWPAAAADLLARITDLSGGPRYGVGPAGAPRSVLDQVLGDHLDLAGTAAALAATGLPDRSEVDRIVAGAAADDLLAPEAGVVVETADGARLPAWSVGPVTGRPVLLVLPCGMPVRLVEGWVRALAVDRRVITWESRWLFADLDSEVDLEHGVAAQVADLAAVLDAFSVPSAHVAGMCGGALLALAAAAELPGRVDSLSLWHGDFDLGDDAPKTDHQRNLQALMGMAAQDRETAAAVHEVLLQNALAGVPADLAHLVLYPYASRELFFRYCRLNLVVMAQDARPYLARVDVDTLVVTSEQDRTAHPAGSLAVAERLSAARLHVEPDGDHLTLFRAPAHLTGLLRSRLAGTASQVG